MIHSPLKTALAYECFQDQASSTLALPSDHKLKTKGTGKQRVQEQVMMTVKRQKQKSSVSSSVGHSNRGNVPPCGGEQGVPFETGAGAVGCPCCELLWGFVHGVRAVCISNGVPGTGDAGVSCVGWRRYDRARRWCSESIPGALGCVCAMLLAICSLALKLPKSFVNLSSTSVP